MVNPLCDELVGGLRVGMTKTKISTMFDEDIMSSALDASYISEEQNRVADPVVCSATKDASINTGKDDYHMVIGDDPYADRGGIATGKARPKNKGRRGKLRCRTTTQKLC